MPSTPVHSEEKETSHPQPGRLYVVATPIGNLGDVTLRALEILRSVSLIAAEDTRHTRKLLSHYDIHATLVSYHTHNARERGVELAGRLHAGDDIALVTDAGTPGISDPGALLVDAALDAGVEVVVIPGPAALIAALVVSGLSNQPFAFLGFPPNRGKGRRRFFASYASLPMTRILYESPHRLVQTLRDCLETWGDRRVAVARELTKRHEEVFRGTVSVALEHFGEGVRGELVLVVEGAVEETGKDHAPDESTGEGGGGWREALASRLEAGGMSVKEAAESISRHYGLPRRQVYQEALRLKNA